MRPVLGYPERVSLIRSSSWSGIRINSPTVSGSASSSRPIEGREAGGGKELIGTPPSCSKFIHCNSIEEAGLWRRLRAQVSSAPCGLCRRRSARYNRSQHAERSSCVPFGSGAHDGRRTPHHILGRMVLPDRIELSTSPLPRECTLNVIRPLALRPPIRLSTFDI